MFGPHFPAPGEQWNQLANATRLDAVIDILVANKLCTMAELLASHRKHLIARARDRPELANILTEFEKNT